MLFPEKIVLNKCERITSEDKGPEPFVLSWIFSVTAIFIDDAMSFQRAVFEQHFEETEKAGKRISELNRIFKRIYEDDINGAISHERFLKLSDEYEAERKELTDFVKANKPPLIPTSRTRPTLAASPLLSVKMWVLRN